MSWWARLLSNDKVRFLLVGSGNSVWSMAVFFGSVHLLGPKVPTVVSLVVAWLVSALTGYLAQRWIVFRAQGQFWGDMARYAGVNYGMFLLNAAVLALLVDIGGVSVVPVQFAVSALAAVFSYLAHKNISFRRR